MRHPKPARYDADGAPSPTPLQVEAHDGLSRHVFELGDGVVATLSFPAPPDLRQLKIVKRCVAKLLMQAEVEAEETGDRGD